MNQVYTESSLEESILEAFFLDTEPQINKFMKDLEKRLILSVLRKVAGNQKEAANILGIKYTTLNMKIKRYGIPLRKELVPGELMIMKAAQTKLLP